MPLGILMAIGLTINTINSIYVLKSGKTIKATVIKKMYEDNLATQAVFSYNDKVFTVSKVQVKQIDTFKVGAELSFFHLDSKPDIFVWTGKSISGYYFDGIFTVTVFIIGVAVLINTIKNWNNKERWVRN